MKNIFPTCLAVIPLLAPVWELRPPTMDDVRTERPRVVSDDAVLFQAEGMRYVDPDLQLRLIHNLAGTGNREAGRLLLTIIEERPETEIRLAVLSQLHRLPFDSERAARAVIPLLGDPDPRLRFWSHRLMADLPVTDSALQAILQTAAADQYLNIRRAALNSLQAHAHHLRFVQIADLTTDAVARVRAAAWLAAAKTANAANHRPELQEAATADPSPLVRHALLEVAVETDPQLGHRLRRQMAADSHPSVRGLVAATARPLGEFNIDDQETMADLALLLQLTGDPDPEVRRAAVESLADFPSPVTVEAAAAGFSDPTGFVRRQAEETMVALAPRIEVTQHVADRLPDPDPEARMHACNTLGRIGAKPYAATIFARLQKETRPQNLAAVITALRRFVYRPAMNSVAAHHQHPSPVVREAVAKALGLIGDSAINSILAELIHDDQARVRQAAITAAGRLRDPYFAPALMTILQDTRNVMPHFSVDDRMAVGWAAPRLQPIPGDLMNRLGQHATQRVVASEIGPMYDAAGVMASAVFAFAEAARRESHYQENLERLSQTYNRALQSSRRNGTFDEFAGLVSHSPILTDIVRQAQAWLAGETEIDPRPARPAPPAMLYEPID